METDYPHPPEDIPVGFHQEKDSLKQSTRDEEATKAADYDIGIAEVHYHAEDLEVKLSDRSRTLFIRKVYGILLAQLSFTAVWIATIASNQTFFLTFLRNRTDLIVICFIASIASCVALTCFRQLARTVPANYLLLSVFTISFSYLTSLTTVLHDPSDITIAGFITAAMAGGLSVYALKTEADYSAVSSFLWSLVFTLVFACLTAVFVPGKLVQVALSVLVALIMSVYIVFDTQMIVGGRYAALSIDDYIFAALMLYVDVMRLFLEILRILGKLKNN